MDALDDIRLLMQEAEDAHRTLVCQPDREHAVRAAVDQLGATGIFTVKASSVCPPGKILVLDEQAIEASWRQTVQRASHGIRLR